MIETLLADAIYCRNRSLVFISAHRRSPDAQKISA
jgi:hypothetical protein